MPAREALQLLADILFISAGVFALWVIGDLIKELLK
jgi:hypothetical protein